MAERTEVPLWTWVDLVRVSGGTVDGAPTRPITGFSIDTRSLVPGDAFVALKDQRDGHEFVTAAFARGAACALVDANYARKPGDGALIHGADPLQMLRRIGIAARARLKPSARVIAVTGSAGKTGTTAMLRAALATAGKTHAPEKSFNNHWGVPLTLARMPEDSDFGVFEIGMNHADEIRPLVKLVRPHLAIVTNVLPVHVGNFPDGETGVANAKAEIFEGLEAGCVAIIPRDGPHFELLEGKAEACGAKIVAFGHSSNADIYPKSLRVEPDQSTVELPSGPTYRLRTPGEHIALNSLAVVAVLQSLARNWGAKFDMDFALQALQFITATPGRGAQRRYLIRAPGSVPLDDILLIDESYNANPASMRAALAVLVATAPAPGCRRIAVLGDMRELGELGPQLHQSLIDWIAPNKVDLVFACGPLMHGLFEQLPEARRGAWSEASTGLIAPLFNALRPGDVVMIKGSLGTNMAPIVNDFKVRDQRLQQEFESCTKPA